MGIQASVGVFPIKQATWFTVPFDYNSTIAVVNPNEELITVTFQAIKTATFDNEPNSEDLMSFQIPPHGQISFFIRSHFFIGGFVTYLGQLHVWTTKGSEKFSAMSFLFPESGVFTSLNTQIRETHTFQHITTSYYSMDDGDMRVLYFQNQPDGTREIKRLHVSVPPNSKVLKVEFQPDSIGQYGFLNLVPTAFKRYDWNEDYKEWFQRPKNACIDVGEDKTLVCNLEDPVSGEWFIEVSASNYLIPWWGGSGWLSVEIN